MKNILSLLLLCLASATPPLYADNEVESTSANTPIVAPAKQSGPDSKQLEKALQNLPWKQFRAIVEAIPKLKADVEAYGPVGWQFVQENYKNYGWKRNIDKLDDAQKKRLAELIENTKSTR